MVCRGRPFLPNVAFRAVMHHMHKRGGKKDWINRGKGKARGVQFWDKEYRGNKDYPHLALSSSPSDDLVKFLKWLERETGRTYLNPFTTVLDLGCGNGRNLVHMADTYAVRGTGYDISKEAVAQATQKAAALGLPQLTFEKHTIADPIPLPDNSQTIVLDMMTSHFLNEAEREQLRKEIHRVLKPGGWFFFKTFLLDEDLNASRMIRDYPSGEHNTYVHPEIGLAEHVSTQEEIEAAFSPFFNIRKITTSHRHQVRGRAFKRRSICVYAQKEE